MTARPERPAIPDIAAVPILDADMPVLPRDSSDARQSDNRRPDQPRSSADPPHHTDPATDKSPISMASPARSDRLRHPSSGSGTT
jgi:hypothetical protein